MLPYLDCQYSPKTSTKIKHLQTTLKQLVVRETKYKAKKCYLFKSEVKYFGKTLARDVSLFDPNKTKTVTQLLKK